MHALRETMSICCTGLFSRMSPTTISGRIPAKLGELRKLEKLDLWDNFLQGEPRRSESLVGRSALLSRKRRVAGSFWPMFRETGTVQASERLIDRRQYVC